MKKAGAISVFTILKGLIFILIIFIILFPLIYMVNVSLSSNIYVMRYEVWLYPKGFNLKMYQLVLKDPRIWNSYINTIKYVVLGTFISLTFTGCAAYALSKSSRLIYYKFFSFMVLIPLFFGGGMIPSYLVVKALNMIDTIWAVVLPGAISAWYVLIMRSFFLSFPHEIEESGMLDGLNDMGIFFSLVIPLSKAVFATIGLFYAVGLWNSFFTPFLYLDDPKKYPLQIVLREIVLQGAFTDQNVANTSRDDFVVEDSLKYATIIVATVPIIAVYPFIQKYFVKGIMLGSLKG